jgi:hypothetical protein
MKACNWLTALSLAMAGLSGMGCSSGSDSQHSEDTGTIMATLTAIGPDGATYALPTNTFLQLVWPFEGGTGNQVLYFNTNSPTQSFAVAPATYTATLYNTTSLARIADAGPASVSATLADAQPYKFTVVAGQTTSLTFHFTIAGIGDVTFSTGTLGTHLQVDSGTATAGHAAVSGSGAALSNALNGPAGLNLALSSPGSVNVSYSINATLTSPFAAAVESSCANITATITATTDTSGNDPNYAALFDEASGGSGTLCFYDASSPVFTGQAVVFLYRSGPPQTMPMIAALGSMGQAGETFQVQIQGTPATPLYDGTTLHLSQINQPLSMPAAGVEAIYSPNNTYLWAPQTNLGTVTLQINP